MQAFHRRNGWQAITPLEAEPWVRDIRRRWLVRMAGLVAMSLIGALARFGLPVPSRSPPVDAVVRPHHAGSLGRM